MDIKWTRTRMLKQSSVQNDDCIIVIPVYKNALKAEEKISLFQCIKLLGDDFEICLAYPKGLNISYYTEISNGFKFNLLECNPEYFKGTDTYSCLCETADFYYAFLGYRYMLIYQLDGWVLKNDLYQFINMNYDYIGSPWPAGSYGFARPSVGNGGVSLRNIDKFIELCNNLNIYDRESKYAKSEDIFFCKYVKSVKKQVQFCIADVKDAMKFGFTTSPVNFYHDNNDQLPMFAHGWNAGYEFEFWKDYIPLEKFEKLNNFDYNSFYEKMKKESLKIKEANIQEFKMDIYEWGSTESAGIYDYGFTMTSAAPQPATVQKQEETEVTVSTVVETPAAGLYTYDNIQMSDVTVNFENIVYTECTHNKSDREYSISEIEKIKNEYNTTYTYEVSEIKKIDKEHPIIVSFTTWKKRIQYMEKFWENLKQQTVQPDKYILWLSSDEISVNDIPDALLDDEQLDICWIDKNIKSFKKFLSIQQYPNAYNIILDDDRMYNKDTVKVLLENAANHANNIISYYCDECNSKGQPWGGLKEQDSTGIKWINDSCVLYPPNMFPTEIFDYFFKIMMYKPLISDECFIMPFIIRHKLNIYNISKGLHDLNKFSPLIKYAEEKDALHIMFTPNGNFKASRKNQLIWDICQELPHEFFDTYKQTFPNFGTDVKDYIIVTLTSWKKRINNVHNIIEYIMDNTILPNKICINLTIEEFPNYEKDLPTVLIDTINQYKSIIEINWIVNNTKVWKKLIPTLCKYRHAVVISIDDDWKYPNDIIETLYNDYCKYDKKYPITGNKIKLFNMNCHCGSGSLTTYDLLNNKNQFNTLSDSCIQVGSDNIFYTYCAFVNGNEYKQSSKMFFRNMTPFQANDAYSQSNDIIEKTYNIAKENYEKSNVSNSINYICKNIIKYTGNAYIDYICENENGVVPRSCYNFNDQIIITMTSWEKRINNVISVLKNIMNNTELPAKIVINLALEEFPNKENSLPANLVKYINDNNIVELNWVKNNTKVWKKSIPTLYKYPNAYILCIDDDIAYPEDFIKTFHDMLKKDSTNAYVGVTWQIANGYNQHCGCSSLDSLKLLKQYVCILDKEIFDTGDEDTFMTYCYKRANIKLEYVGKKFFTNLPAISANDSYTAANKINTRGNWQLLSKKYDSINFLEYLNKINGIDKKILICIFNYKQDNNAKKWLHLLQNHFDTYVLDSGNDHQDPEFIQFDNIYYSGLWNEMKKIVDNNKQYKWVGIITSDVTIEEKYENILIDKIKWLLTTTNIGQYQPSLDNTSANGNHKQQAHKQMMATNFIEGMFTIMNRRIFDKMPYIDTTQNLYGMYIDNVFSALCIYNNLYNIQDNTYTIHHPDSSGYSKSSRQKYINWCNNLKKTLLNIKNISTNNHELWDKDIINPIIR